MRKCGICGKENIEAKTGPLTCKECRKEKGRLAKQQYNSSEKGKQTSHNLYLRHRVLHPRVKLTQAELLERRRRRDKKRDKNPERIAKEKEWHRRYIQSEKGRAMMAMRNARRYEWVKNTPNPLTAAQWLEILKQHRYHCHYCHKKTKLTLDHVIPLSKGGQHTATNVVPACPHCNSTKHDKITMLL